MFVSEIKALLPEADVYKLDPREKYLVIVRKGNISNSVFESLQGVFKDMKIEAVTLAVAEDVKQVRILGMD